MKGKYFWWFLGTVSLLFFTVIIFYYSHFQSLGKAKIVFLDVGQGSSAYIKTVEGYEIIVDSGSSRAVLRELSKHRPFWDRHIDLVIATHADGDHIGAMPDLLERFDIDLYLDNGQERVGNGPYDVIANQLSENGIDKLVPRPREKLFIGFDTEMEFLFPYPEYADNLGLNKSSLVFIVMIGQTKILFTGDAPESIEQYLVREYGDYLKSDILAVGHHGSKTSSSQEFLEIVGPDYAVISAGRDNPHGHPHTEVLERIELLDITILGTYEQGSVEFVTK